MSEAPNDDALEAQALAAMESDDKADPADTPEAPAKPDQKSRLEATAEKIGWNPNKDAYKGDGDWLDAPEFILKAAGEVLPSMRKSLEKANDEIKGLKASVKTAITHMSKADERAYTKARADLEAELEQYATAGNAKAVKEVTDDLLNLDREAAARPKPDATPDDPPEFAAWKEDNPWFGKDKALTAATAAIGEEATAEGYTGKALIKEVDRRVREQFPEKFAKPNNPLRNGPAAVEGGGPAGRRPSGKSFSDMPRDAQEMCLDLMKLSKAITKENYAAQHFADQGKSR